MTGMTLSYEASQYYGIPEGVLVSEVTEGGAAEDAGIKEKSIITEFDGKRVRSIDELVSRLEYYEPGEEVEVTLEVADHHLLNIKIQIPTKIQKMIQRTNLMQRTVRIRVMVKTRAQTVFFRTLRIRQKMELHMNSSSDSSINQLIAGFQISVK